MVMTLDRVDPLNNLDQFAKDSKNDYTPHRNSTECWLDARPNVQKEVADGVTRHPVVLIWRYLVRVHDFPFKYGAFYAWAAARRSD